MNSSIHQLLHLVSISFAVGLAYIALDRFRYTNRVKEMLRRAITEVDTRIKEKNPAQEDTAVARLKNDLKTFQMVVLV